MRGIMPPTLEELTNAALQWLINNPNGTQVEFIAFVVGLGVPQEQAVQTLGLYLAVLVQLGYIDTPQFSSIQNWINARTEAQVMSVVSILLETPEFQLVGFQADLQRFGTAKSELEAAIVFIDARIAELSALASPTEQEGALLKGQLGGKALLGNQVSVLERTLAQITGQLSELQAGLAQGPQSPLAPLAS